MLNDDAYSCAPYIEGGEAWFQHWEDRASLFRAREASVGRARLNLPYGAHERQRFDLFYPSGRPKGLIVFLHGGYWRRFGREYFSHCAEGVSAMGWACALPSYPLAPEVSINDITASSQQAIEEAAKLIAGPLVVTGHSAGGHLSARLLCPDARLSPAVLARIKRVVPISPLSDLRPLMATSMNAELKLDAESALAESPALAQPLRALDCLVWVGADERPAFLDQARWLADAVPGARLHVEPKRHHFDVIEDLAEADSALTRALIEGVMA